MRVGSLVDMIGIFDAGEIGNDGGIEEAKLVNCKKKSSDFFFYCEETKDLMLKCMVTECMIRSMSYYDNRQRSFN